MFWLLTIWINRKYHHETTPRTVTWMIVAELFADWSIRQIDRNFISNHSDNPLIMRGRFKHKFSDWSISNVTLNIFVCWARPIYWLADIICQYWPITENRYWWCLISADLKLFGFKKEIMQKKLLRMIYNS